MDHLRSWERKEREPFGEKMAREREWERVFLVGAEWRAKSFLRFSIAEGSPVRRWKL